MKFLFSYRRVLSLAALAAFALGILGSGDSFARERKLKTYDFLGGSKQFQPGYGTIENFTILGYTDLDGWDRPTEIRVSKDGKYAYTASNPPPTDGRNNGVTITDVSDPKNPKVVSRINNGPTEHNQYVDVIDNILVVNQERLRVRDRRKRPKKYNSGIRIFDVSNPAAPKFLSYYRSDKPGRRRLGVHGLWLHKDDKGRNYAFLATSTEGYFGNILQIVDISDPAKPKQVGRWHYPGQHSAGGEKRPKNWARSDRGGRIGLPKILVWLHDITTYKDRAYLSYRDQGVIILDISDITKPKMLSQIKWTPPEQGNSHSIGVVVPKDGGRPKIIVATDEINHFCPWGYMRIIDVRNESNPQQLSTFRLPMNRYCPPDRPGRDFGIHDVDRMIRGNIVFSAWQQSGFWAIDISDPHAPKAVGSFVPPAFVRGGLDHSTADDLFVHENGLVYATSNEPGGGLWILKYTPGVKGTVAWNKDQKSVTVTYQK